MSWMPDKEPDCLGDKAPAVETVIVPRARDLGGFEVRRALPARERRLVGPFIFFDEIGPAQFLPGQGVDVRPHPHIGLATVTYLFDGEFQHRDSLGTDQMIHPGEVNWMIAGRGVTHSERTSARTRAGAHGVAGIQTWVALPADAEDDPPSFEHHKAQDLPVIEDAGVSARLILGRSYGQRAPVTTPSEMFYLDVRLEPGASIPLPDDHEDRAAYVLAGEAGVAGERFEAGRMLVFRPGDALALTAGEQGTRLMLLGGATLEGPRHIWWNFVSSSKEKIEAAKDAWRKEDWANGPFPLPPGDSEEFTPAPAG